MTSIFHKRTSVHCSQRYIMSSFLYLRLQYHHWGGGGYWSWCLYGDNRNWKYILCRWIRD